MKSTYPFFKFIHYNHAPKGLLRITCELNIFGCLGQYSILLPAPKMNQSISVSRLEELMLKSAKAEGLYTNDNIQILQDTYVAALAVLCYSNRNFTIENIEVLIRLIQIYFAIDDRLDSDDQKTVDKIIIQNREKISSLDSSRYGIELGDSIRASLLKKIIRDNPRLNSPIFKESLISTLKSNEEEKLMNSQDLDDFDTQAKLRVESNGGKLLVIAGVLLLGIDLDAIKGMCNHLIVKLLDSVAYITGWDNDVFSAERELRKLLNIPMPEKIASFGTLKVAPALNNRFHLYLKKGYSIQKAVKQVFLERNNEIMLYFHYKMKIINFFKKYKAFLIDLKILFDVCESVMASSIWSFLAPKYNFGIRAPLKTRNALNSLVAYFNGLHTERDIRCLIKINILSKETCQYEMLRIMKNKRTRFLLATTSCIPNIDTCPLIQIYYVCMFQFLASSHVAQPHYWCSFFQDRNIQISLNFFEGNSYLLPSLSHSIYYQHP